MSVPHPVDKQVGDQIRSRRVALGISPGELADALATSVQQILEWEAGASRIGATHLLSLVEILDVETEYFFAGENPTRLH